MYYNTPVIASCLARKEAPPWPSSRAASAPSPSMRRAMTHHHVLADGRDRRRHGVTRDSVHSARRRRVVVEAVSTPVRFDPAIANIA